MRSLPLPLDLKDKIDLLKQETHLQTIRWPLVRTLCPRLAIKLVPLPADQTLDKNVRTLILRPVKSLWTLFSPDPGLRDAQWLPSREPNRSRHLAQLSRIAPLSPLSAATLMLHRAGTLHLS